MLLPLLHVIPHNSRARECLQGKENAHFFGRSTDEDESEPRIKVSLMNTSKTLGSIISFGMLGDIYVSGSNISKTHFLILMHEKSREIIFRDTSTFRSSTLRNTSDDRTEMLCGVPRQAVVRREDSVILGIGGLRNDLFQFRISWPVLNAQLQEEIEEIEEDYLSRYHNPLFAVTLDARNTQASRYETRLQTPWESGTQLVHRKLEMLGHGSFGTVYKAVDMHSGEHIAVKSLRLDPRHRNDYAWKRQVIREVEILHGLSHAHLSEFRHCQGFHSADSEVEIFMTLYDGNLEDALHNKPEFSQDNALITVLFRQTLSAIVYLAYKSILHRDVKPANVLFKGSYHWVLGDFGLAKVQDHGLTRAGSGNFIAPEILSGRHQTHKVDVYSLGMTILYSLGSRNLRRNIHSSESLWEYPEFQAALERSQKLKPLLERAPDQRPSAQQTYLDFFGDDPEIGSQTPAELPPPVAVNIFAEPSRPQQTTPSALNQQQNARRNRLRLSHRKTQNRVGKNAAGTIVRTPKP